MTHGGTLGRRDPRLPRTSTTYKVNRNWNRRGSHKPRSTK